MSFARPLSYDVPRTCRTYGSTYTDLPSSDRQQQTRGQDRNLSSRQLLGHQELENTKQANYRSPMISDVGMTRQSSGPSRRRSRAASHTSTRSNASSHYDSDNNSSWGMNGYYSSSNSPTHTSQSSLHDSSECDFDHIGSWSDDSAHSSFHQDDTPHFDDLRLLKAPSRRLLPVPDAPPHNLAFCHCCKPCAPRPLSRVEKADAQRKSHLLYEIIANDIVAWAAAYIEKTNATHRHPRIRRQ